MLGQFYHCQQQRRSSAKSESRHRTDSTYEPYLLRQEMERTLQSIGGLNDVVTLGARVGIKPNLTGEPRWDGTGKPLVTELFVTHPAIVNALGEVLLDMGVANLSLWMA